MSLSSKNQSRHRGGGCRLGLDYGFIFVFVFGFGFVFVFGFGFGFVSLVLPHPRPEAGNTNWWRLGPSGRGGRNGNRQCETRVVCLPVSSGRLLGIQFGTFAWKPVGDVSFEASSGRFACQSVWEACMEASSGRLLGSQLGTFASITKWGSPSRGPPKS